MMFPKAKLTNNRFKEEHKRKFNLLVEWTNYCNISCAICPIDAPTMRKPGHMSLELWGKILDDCKRNDHHVNWVHHLGEPLLWKYFEKGMEMWKESGLSVKGHISTNGILLDEDKIRIIRNTEIGFLRICIDTLREEVYRKIRRNNNHSLIIDNIRMVLEKAPELKVQVQLMRTTLNLDENPEEYFEFFGRHKNLSIFYSTVMDLGKKCDFNPVTGKRLNPRYCDKIDYQHCIIGWDGTVGLCCGDYWLANRLGNIKSSSISEVFDGRFANELRRMIKAGDFSLAPTCKTCSMDHMKPLVRKLVGSYESNQFHGLL